MQASPCGRGDPCTPNYEETMAIYHLTTKPISRSSGRSATASAAYRAADKIIDARTGEVHDYSRKKGVVHSEILVPEGIDKNGITRSDLWNAAEAAENRKDARVAREIIIALPHELDEKARIDLARSFGKTLAKGFGCAVDVCVHEPNKDGDDRNHHAHLLMTTRKVNVVDGVIELGDKTTIELSNSKRKELNLKKSQDVINNIRKKWANMANRALEKNGRDERVSHESLKSQGIDRIPQIHVGVHATSMDRKGEYSERAELNKNIKETNVRKEELKTEKTGIMEELETVDKAITTEENRLKAEAEAAKQCYHEAKYAFDEIKGAIGYPHTPLTKIDSVIEGLEKQLNDDETIEAKAMTLIDTAEPPIKLKLKDGSSVDIHGAKDRCDELEDTIGKKQAYIDECKPKTSLSVGTWDPEPLKQHYKNMENYWKQEIRKAEKVIESTKEEYEPLNKRVLEVVQEYLDKVRESIRTVIDTLKGIRDRLTPEAREYGIKYEAENKPVVKVVEPGSVEQAKPVERQQEPEQDEPELTM